MASLIDKPPNGMTRGANFTLFYFGVKPLELSNLAERVRFTCVYLPTARNGWQLVRFEVVSNGFRVVGKSDSEQAEIEHFEKPMADGN
jgi:hypothetical protein